MYDPSVVVVLPTNQLSSCLESLTIDDLYPSITLNGFAISDMRDERDDRDDDDSAEKKSASSSNDLEQVLLVSNSHTHHFPTYHLCYSTVTYRLFIESTSTLLNWLQSKLG